MSKAAEILARVRDRKRRLHEETAALSWEWWDHAPTSEIYHPAEDPDLSDGHTSLHAENTLALTAKERRRKRRLNRSESREIVRQQIELGIVKPPPPKLSRKNVAAVYGAAYVKDPTKLELMAQEAEDERRQRHEASNRERQLSGREKWLKMRNKMKAHRQSALHCTVFFGTCSLGPKELSILDYAAKKYLCTGVCLLGAKGSFVLVEGGEPELAKIGKLVSKKFELGLVWRGILPAQNFEHWSIHSTPDWHDILQPHGVESLLYQLHLD